MYLLKQSGKYIFLVFFILSIDFLFQNCANPGRPSGGSKDTIPPTLIESNPSIGAVLFEEKTIEMTFSELINVEKIKQKLIIIPKLDIDYKYIIKKNKLIIKFDNEFLDSTTYNFNFADAVTDITEKNPVINLSLAISTGEYIDSLSVQGIVSGVMDEKAGKKYLVGLYPLSDSLDYFTDNPLYFSTTNDSGIFKMNYIKNGTYKILAFNDENQNLLLNPEKEAHGFLEDTIFLDSSKSLIPIRYILQNVKPIKLINQRSIGPHVEIKFSKTIHSYTINPANLNHNIVGKNKETIRIYKSNNLSYNDSTTIYITASDKLNNAIQDTLKISFLESSKKLDKLTYATNKSPIPFKSNSKHKFTFNKPIYAINLNNIQIIADTLLNYKPLIDTSWNLNKTVLDISVYYKISILDSLILEKLPESIKIDTLGNINKDIERSIPLFISFKKGSFISVEKDSSEALKISFKELKPKPIGTLIINLNTSKSSYVLQLLNSKKEIAHETKNKNKIEFNDINPGNYSIRILIDTNLDGQWSSGNLLKNEEPEEIFFYKEEISIRENWIVELDITF